MNTSLNIGELEICWLNGGAFELDGGTMFGAVPKKLWTKKFPSTDNYIKLVNSPLLIKTPDKLVVVETGFGNKLTEKQQKIFRVSRDWDIPASLSKIGMDCDDVDFVILTHCDFDHAGGIVSRFGDDTTGLTFPRARHIIQEKEFYDATHPNRRSAHTYWQENFSLLQDSANLHLVNGSCEVCPGIEVVPTGGHTRGHQIVKIQSAGQTAYHLADLLPTHAHFNPLWIMAYDNFPLEVVERKEALEELAIQENAWFTFYHDPFMRACRFDRDGNVLEQVPAAE